MCVGESGSFLYTDTCYIHCSDFYIRVLTRPRCTQVNLQMIKHLLRLLIVLQISSLIYAADYASGMTMQLEWLEPKKLQISWTPVTHSGVDDPPVDQQYYITMTDYDASKGWDSVPLPIDEFSLIIDDVESDKIFSTQGANPPFPGWSGFSVQQVYYQS